MIFLDVTLPVFLVAGIGYAFARLTKLDVVALGRIVFYVFGPALIFRSVYTAELDPTEVARIAGFAVAYHAVLFIVSRLHGRLRRLDEDTQSAATLALTLGNHGTYGLPVVYFMFGDRGLALAVVFLVCAIVLQSTFGVGVAMWRRGTRPWNLVAGVFRVPWIYAFLAALAVRTVNVSVPDGLWRGIELVADGAIPLQLVLLGMELARLRVGAIAATTAELTLLRTIGAPLLALGLAAAVGAEGLLFSVLIIQGSMPSAINSMILAIRYDRRPDLAASVVFLTTLLSLASLTVVLHLVA